LCAKRGVAAVGGVHGVDGERGFNSVRISLPLVEQEFIQYKHHRWQLDKSQIKAYGLGGTLSSQRLWWENIHIRERELQFFSVLPELTISALICEDLARQDPVGEILRAVGPNLVIALLMDGPQLNGRWASRYASVLADDPGSSVLTLTSLGMCLRSRPNGAARSTVVASWKDPTGPYQELCLEGQEEGLLLNLQFQLAMEWTVDGRNDGVAASVPVLCGVHPLGC
jgi:hypothetical protein